MHRRGLASCGCSPGDARLRGGRLWSLLVGVAAGTAVDRRSRGLGAVRQQLRLHAVPAAHGRRACGKDRAKRYRGQRRCPGLHHLKRVAPAPVRQGRDRPRAHGRRGRDRGRRQRRGPLAVLRQRRRLLRPEDPRRSETNLDEIVARVHALTSAHKVTRGAPRLLERLARRHVRGGEGRRVRRRRGDGDRRGEHGRSSRRPPRPARPTSTSAPRSRGPTTPTTRPITSRTTATIPNAAGHQQIADATDAVIETALGLR